MDTSFVNIIVRKWADQRKKGIKDQETIQLSTTLDPGYHMESNKNAINITNKSQEVRPFPAGDHKAAMNRCKSMKDTRHKKHKWSTKEVQAVMCLVKHVDMK